MEEKEALEKIARQLIERANMLELKEREIAASLREASREFFRRRPVERINIVVDGKLVSFTARKEYATWTNDDFDFSDVGVKINKVILC